MKTDMKMKRVSVSATFASLLLPAVLLLGAGILLFWLTPPEGRWSDFYRVQWIGRQAACGVLALALAWGMGRYRLHRPFLRHWYVFPALLLLVMIAAPVSAWAGRAVMVNGRGWWTRAVGQGTYLLALIFAVAATLPRYAAEKRGGAWAVAGVLVFSAIVPIAFLKDSAAFLSAFAVLGLAGCCTMMSTPRRRHLLLAILGVFSLAALAWIATNQANERLARALNQPTDANFQIGQAWRAIRAGGVIGGGPSVWIPEWHTDFLFARLCNAGGAMAGIVALLVAGLLLVSAWRITGRQTDLRSRVLAVGCATALTAPALLHVAVNLGLFPTTAVHFPFFSYAPRLLLLDGVLAGLLISLGREAPQESQRVTMEGADEQ